MDGALADLQQRIDLSRFVNFPTVRSLPLLTPRRVKVAAIFLRSRRLRSLATGSAVTFSTVGSRLSGGPRTRAPTNSASTNSALTNSASTKRATTIRATTIRATTNRATTSKATRPAASAAPAQPGRRASDRCFKNTFSVQQGLQLWDLQAGGSIVAPPSRRLVSGITAAVALLLALGVAPGVALAETVRILADDGDAYQCRVDAISTASQEIFLASYEIGDGEAALYCLALLRDASRRGVDVRVLVDGHRGTNLMPKRCRPT